MGNPRFAPDAKAPLRWTNDDINFTKIARMQIATLPKWRVPDVRAGQSIAGCRRDACSRNWELKAACCC
ncbi:hypothetical protein EMIT0P294_50326 [Pseudomonas sp. IT-P294]